MLHTLPEAERAAAYPRTSVEPLENLSGTALRLYRALCDVGRTVGRARGYVAGVSLVYYFAPGEVVADAVGMARSTLYRKLEELRTAGLVEARAHYVSHRNRTRADGMVWGVRLDPELPGPVNIPLDYLKASYRCLSADIEAGRTAWKLTKSDSHKTPSSTVDTQKILVWALPPPNPQNHVMALTVRPDLERLLDLPHVAREDRAEAVDGAARALSTGLGDPGAVMFYRWLLWQLLRRCDAGLDTPWGTVYEQARRAQADVREGFARGGNGGRLFTARLKLYPWWPELARASGRVGSRPRA